MSVASGRPWQLRTKHRRDMEQPKHGKKVHLVIGGTSSDIFKHVLSLADGLRRMGYHILIIGPLDRDARVQLNDLGLSWVNLALPTGIRIRNILRTRRALAEVFAKEKPDVIHCHGYRATALASRARSASAGSALICTAHTLPAVPPRPRLEAIARRYVYSHLAEWADRVVCVSNAVLDELAKFAPGARASYRTIYPGVDPRVADVDVDPAVKKVQLGLDPMAASVGVVAPLVPDKGIDVFFKAAAKLSEGIGNIDFVVVGDGPERDRLAEQAHQLHLTGSVVFLGERRDVPEILASLDAVVIPSRREAFSYVALATLAIGTPLIATTAGALPEILGEAEKVQLVQPEDPEGMAQAILRVLNEVSDDDEMTPFAPSAVDALSGEVSSSVDITMRKDEYDLDEADLERKRPEEQAGRAASGRRLVWERFTVARFLEEIRAVYDEACAARAQG